MAPPSSSFSLLLLLLLLLLPFFLLVFPSYGIETTALLSSPCKASTNPAKCLAALSGLTGPSGLEGLSPLPLDSIKSLLSTCSDNLKVAQSLVKEIADDASPSANVNLTNGAKKGVEALHECSHRLNLTAEAVRNGRDKEARAWMSAALAHQYNVWSGFQKYVNDSTLTKVKETVAAIDGVMSLSSDALNMMRNYDIHGNYLTSWEPAKTERDGFWEEASRFGSEYLGLFFEKGNHQGGGSRSSEFNGGVPRGLTADVTVCGGDGGCDYKLIQEAVNAAPESLTNLRFVIHIKEGVYNETVRVPLEKRNVVFLGDGMGKTVITGSLNVGIPLMTTAESATVAVVGDGFMASNLTIQNTAGSDAQQAVAFRSDSDRSVIENCEFIGNQDTLYVKTMRQYFKSCRIQGNVDFIFGNSAAYFQDCVILISPRTSNPEKGAQNAVTAHGRTHAAQSTGFVFKNCVINGTKEMMELYSKTPQVHKNYLGRPWKEHCRTVFIDCVIEGLIDPEGWMPWSGDFALKTVYYGEFGSTGAGANKAKRAPWSSQIPAEHIHSYSVQNFIQGNEWIPTI